ncbi:MAG TPA: hypothetical protein PLD46_02775 [Hyphomicrobium sp.]|nr:hypothetical protein [Hyphomicrobium sp.]
MRSAYVIEVGDEQVGLVIREEGERQFQFHAATKAYNALEGQLFADPLKAERVAIAHAAALRNRRKSQVHQNFGGFYE